MDGSHDGCCHPDYCVANAYRMVVTCTRRQPIYAADYCLCGQEKPTQHPTCALCAIRETERRR